MKTLRAFKYRMYPTVEIKQQLAQFFGAKRWTFNHFLAENKTRFLEKQKHQTKFDINNQITQLKKQPNTAWLRGIDDWCLKHASEDLANAYSNFFNSIKKRTGSKAKAPVFKSKYSRQSYRTRGVKVDFAGNRVKLPKLGWVKAIVHREFSGVIKSATVSLDSSGQYYISCLVEVEVEIQPSKGREIGIDLGIKDLVICSNSVKFKQLELTKATLALKLEQRKLARKTKGSNNYKKQRLLVASRYQTITNMRMWYLHNISRWLVNNHDSIYAEDLNIKGMLKNRKLSRSISDASWGKLIRLIQYKSVDAGVLFYQIDRFYPSSKTCSSCGTRNNNMTLKDREWDCSCGVHHDRDVNAAVNIKRAGQTDCYNQYISDETAEMGEIPMSLQKYTNKTERSADGVAVGAGSKKAIVASATW